MTSVRSITNFLDYKLQSFRLLEDNQVYLYLTTETIKTNFGIEVEPVGSIHGINVIDPETLLEAFENHRPELAEELVSSVNYTRDTVIIDNFELLSYRFEDGIALDFNSVLSQCRKLPHGKMLSLLKACGVSLDGTGMLSLSDAVTLLKVYGRQLTKPKKVKAKGFG